MLGVQATASQMEMLDVMLLTGAAVLTGAVVAVRAGALELPIVPLVDDVLVKLEVLCCCATTELFDKPAIVIFAGITTGGFMNFWSEQQHHGYAAVRHRHAFLLLWREVFRWREILLILHLDGVGTVKDRCWVCSIASGMHTVFNRIRGVRFIAVDG